MTKYLQPMLSADPLAGLRLGRQVSGGSDQGRPDAYLDAIGDPSQSRTLLLPPGDIGSEILLAVPLLDNHDAVSVFAMTKNPDRAKARKFRSVLDRFRQVQAGRLNFLRLDVYQYSYRNPVRHGFLLIESFPATRCRK